MKHRAVKPAVPSDRIVTMKQLRAERAKANKARRARRTP